MVGQGIGQRITGLRLFAQQCGALLKKNAILSLRNKRATFLQLAASFFFIFLIFVVDKAITAVNRDTTSFKNLFDPKPEPVKSIPRCEEGFYIKLQDGPCYDFLWSGTGPNIETIVRNIRERNPGRPIPESKVRSFASTDDVDRWLKDNPMRCPGALHFEEQAPGVIAYGVQTNSTAKQQRGKYEDTVFKFRIPLLAAAEREISRFVTNDPNLEWSVTFTEFAHPAIETFSAFGSVGPTFLLAAAMFGFVIQISNLVTERELKLRQTMSTMGLIDSAYWLTWLLWEMTLGFVSSILLIIFGLIFQFDFFKNNNFGVLFFLFFLFQVNMTGLAFLLSTFITKAASATTAGFFFFILGFLTQLVTLFGFPYDSASKGIQAIWSLFPPNLLAIGLSHLGDATATKQDKGISWSGRNDCPEQKLDCAITLGAIYNWLIALFVVFFLLALFFDNVLPDVNGVKKPWSYFLRPSYWTGKSAASAEGGGCCSCTSSTPAPPSSEYAEDEDVVAEEELVKGQPPAQADHPNVAVQVRGLVKTFPGVAQLGCFKCKRTEAYHAVKGVWFNIEKDKLFCLLGPNGAGKTTTINCLTGVIPTTSGDGMIYGHSVRDTGGINQIRSFMGVCPQFDILWESLSAEEHLYLFATIKGLPSSDIKSVASELLAQVKLSDAAKIRSGSFSGGMKRRLSVAIALIGDPKIVFLDEPTTGMDPITRRYVWDIIETAKKGRAIVLTTHSMEEADILGDRIAIMAKGRLRCIGTSIHLKSRFGSGYVVNVSVRKATKEPVIPEEDERRRSNVRKYFMDGLGLAPADENKAYITFVVPRSSESKLTEFFLGLHEREKELGVTDIQLSLSTLDEVFLKIARQAELETAAAEGRYELLTITPRISVQVPIGAPFVSVPGTESAEVPFGMMVEVDWQQDDSGSLKISGHSEMRPAPPPPAGSGDVAPNALHYRRSLSRRKVPSIGRAIDPSEISSSAR